MWQFWRALAKSSGPCVVSLQNRLVGTTTRWSSLPRSLGSFWCGDGGLCAGTSSRTRSSRFGWSRKSFRLLWAQHGIVEAVCQVGASSWTRRPSCCRRSVLMRGSRKVDHGYPSTNYMDLVGGRSQRRTQALRSSMWSTERPRLGWCENSRPRRCGEHKGARGLSGRRSKARSERSGFKRRLQRHRQKDGPSAIGCRSGPMYERCR